MVILDMYISHRSYNNLVFILEKRQFIKFFYFRIIIIIIKKNMIVLHKCLKNSISIIRLNSCTRSNTGLIQMHYTILLNKLYCDRKLKNIYCLNYFYRIN